jgi:hypothetical protein
MRRFNLEDAAEWAVVVVVVVVVVFAVRYSGSTMKKTAAIEMSEGIIYGSERGVLLIDEKRCRDGVSIKR